MKQEKTMIGKGVETYALLCNACNHLTLLFITKKINRLILLLFFSLLEPMRNQNPLQIVLPLSI